MRFQIANINGDHIEMIGDVVEMPNDCGEVFVVHYNPFFDESCDLGDVDSELFRVSHVGTGRRIRGGATIDAAIEIAAAKMRNAGADGVKAAIERFREHKAA